MAHAHGRDLFPPVNLNLDNGLILLRIKVRIHLLALVALADDHGLIQRGERSNFVYRRE